MFRITSTVFLVICLFISCATIGSGQQNVAAATVSGVIEDVNGAVIAGASVLVVNSSTNQGQTTISNASGRFRFNYLPVGSYELKATKDGFEGANQKFTATVGIIRDRSTSESNLT